jgi:hypothetical protein
MSVSLVMRLYGKIIKLIGIKAYLLVLLLCYIVWIYGVLSSPLRPGRAECHPSNSSGFAIQRIIDENFCKLKSEAEYRSKHMCRAGKFSYYCGP